MAYLLLQTVYNKWNKLMNSFKPILFLAALSFSTLAVGHPQEPILKLSINSIKPTQGELYYQLFSCAKGTTDLWSDLTPLLNAKVTVIGEQQFVNLAATVNQHYCVRVYQDTNANGQIDFGTGGIPREAVGFSDNPNLLLGYPTPSDTVFYHDGKTAVAIKMNYPRHRRRRH